MKDLPVSVMDWLNNRPGINPCFLIEIALDETLYLSTRQEFTFGGVTYTPGRIVGQIQISQDQAAFGVVNEDYKHTTPALTGQYQRSPVKIWWTEGFDVPALLIEHGYVEDGYYDTESRTAPTLLFDGHLSHFEQITSVLGVVASRSAARRYPTLRVLPPIANFVRPSGTIIRLGSNTYRLESRD